MQAYCKVKALDQIENIPKIDRKWRLLHHRTKTMLLMPDSFFSNVHLTQDHRSANVNKQSSLRVSADLSLTFLWSNIDFFIWYVLLKNGYNIYRDMGDLELG